MVPAFLPPRHKERKEDEMVGKQQEPLPRHTEDLATEIVDAVFHVHQTLGPGLLGSVYQTCLSYELTTRQIPFQSEIQLPITYKEIQLESGLRMDLVVDDLIILELKAVEKIIPIHEAQLLTYLKLSKKRLGFLINFNTPLIKNGIKRIIR